MSRRAIKTLMRHASTSSSPSNPALASIAQGPTARSRYQEHYHTTLAPALMYLTYDHHLASLDPSTIKDPTEKIPQWDPSNPYTKNRPSQRPRGGQPLVPKPRAITNETVVKLESIIVHTFVKESIGNKNALVPVVAAFEAMTGEPDATHLKNADDGKGRGIRIARTGNASASFKVRKGLPAGVKVKLQGESMYTFLETLVELVLPRLKDWQGVRLPPPSANPRAVSQLGGVVSFGLPPQAMSLFPAIETNLDAYPRMHGFHIQFLTNARGIRAQDQARALVSGYRIPFVKA